MGMQDIERTWGPEGNGPLDSAHHTAARDCADMAIEYHGGQEEMAGFQGTKDWHHNQGRVMREYHENASDELSEVAQERARKLEEYRRAADIAIRNRSIISKLAPEHNADHVCIRQQHGLRCDARSQSGAVMANSINRRTAAQFAAMGLQAHHSPEQYAAAMQGHLAYLETHYNDLANSGPGPARHAAKGTAGFYRGNNPREG